MDYIKTTSFKPTNTHQVGVSKHRGKWAMKQLFRYHKEHALRVFEEYEKMKSQKGGCAIKCWCFDPLPLVETYFGKRFERVLCFRVNTREEDHDGQLYMVEFIHPQQSSRSEVFGALIRYTMGDCECEMVFCGPSVLRHINRISQKGGA